jgi:hypothetical protein
MNWKELEDYEGFPKLLRKFQVEAIGKLVVVLGVYKSIPSVVNELLLQNKFTSIIDLCSGSGLPSLYIKDKLQYIMPLTLTDKFPQTIKETNGVIYESISINLFDIHPKPNVLYTLFNAYHHFTPTQQIQLIEKFKQNKATLLIVEVVEPSFISMINVIIASTLLQLIITPFIKPFHWLRILFTYIIPINIITVFIDGIISILKSKTKKQYKTMLQHLNTNDFSVEVNSIFNFPSKIITIIAQPNHATT